MRKRCGTILFLAMAAVVTVSALPCQADEGKQEDKSFFETEDQQRGRRPRRWRIELTKEEIGRILESLKKDDPEKATELVKLQGRDPEQFNEELRQLGGEEYQKILRERYERFRQQRRVDFLDWLEKNYRRDARELARLKGRDPDLYEKKYGAMREKYDPIREAERRNPELAVILKEDLRLQERRDELTAKIKTTKKEDEKKKLIAELQDVLDDRYDLIVERKVIAYARLIKRLEELQNWIKKSRAEIAEARKDEVKAENVRQRMKTLLEGKRPFSWGD
ncbi:MAG: hypothetical protein AMJ65_08450 [Phycisphaerae bacterium SG8_4]|nr:MAG: hypothetical protein AMJ65_08450 [Phycisphaerae bacterium SG8_4]